MFRHESILETLGYQIYVAGHGFYRPTIHETSMAFEGRKVYSWSLGFGKKPCQDDLEASPFLSWQSMDP